MSTMQKASPGWADVPHRPSPPEPSTHPSIASRASRDALRTVAARLTAVEHELAEARTALAAAEAAVTSGRQQSLVPDAYTTEQVARTLGLSRSTIAEMLRRGDIRSVKLGGSRRVFRADLDAYIAAVRAEAS
jgi:excisionase family DNA binding protein